MYRGFDKKQLETQYSPSSCIDDIMVYINQYIDNSKAVLEQAQSDKSVIENISYGDTKEQTLDLYLPKDLAQKTGKLQVYIHGGYWQELSKNESSFAASNFQQHDCHFAVINYTLAPKASLSEIVEENRKALVHLYLNAEKYGFHKEEIYISGSSAGGHLALMMLLTDWAMYGLNAEQAKSFIKGVCAVSGVYDLEPIQYTYVNDPLKLTFTETIQNSPILHQVKNPCPIILAYGENETSEFKRQSMEMSVFLKQQGLDVELKEISERNHFDVIMDLSDSDSWLFQQTIKQMGL